MKIADSSISLHASHDRQSYRARFDAVRVTRPAPASPPTGRVSISGAGRQALAAAPAPAATTAPVADDAAPVDATTDPRLGLLVSLIEFLTGRPVRIYSAGRAMREAMPEQADPPPASAAASAITVEIERREVREETESTAVEAAGWIGRDDGTTLRIEMSLHLARHERQEATATLRIGNTARKDPLVINFAGTAKQLLEQRMRFDLDGSGTAADIPLLAEGLAYLALDRNGNGKIDSGRELFGPETDNGFAELSRHDDDGNGWIDEADPVFSRLALWRPSPSGAGRLQTLSSAGIGGLGLSHASTPFQLNGRNGTELGAVRATGVAVTETGIALALHEIDLVAG